MMKSQIVLEFESITLDAELFGSPIANRIAESLPVIISLEQWGNELYGSVGIDFGEESPVPEIPPGGIAYTNNGNYVCIFLGQTPAWPVEYIGQITGGGWKKLIADASFDFVKIRLK